MRKASTQAIMSMTRSSGHAMATTSTTAMMTTNVDDKASGTSARHFQITSRSGGDDNNYWQQRTTSVGWQGLVRKHTAYSQCQAHILRVKHRRNNKPGNIKLRPRFRPKDQQQGNQLIINMLSYLWESIGLLCWVVVWLCTRCTATHTHVLPNVHCLTFIVSR
jgi:hypothetical protein